jgi:hypothetical protein
MTQRYSAAALQQNTAFKKKYFADRVKYISLSRNLRVRTPKVK